MKTVGILGGMGPEASCRWYEAIIKMMQNKYHFTQDNEFPEMYLFNLKLEGWSERGIEDNHLVNEQMAKYLGMMNLLKPDVIIMACNTIHKYIEPMSWYSQAPVWNMIRICKIEVADKGYKNPGILCSSTTNKEKLYGDIIYCTEEEQLLVDGVILRCQGGNTTQSDKELLGSLCNKLKKRGADCIILGCTELPLLFNSSCTQMPLFDAGYILLDKLTNEINN